MTAMGFANSNQPTVTKIVQTLAIITQVATYIANALVGGVSNPDLEKKA